MNLPALHSRAWSCAFELAHNHADRLTLDQLVACHCVTMRRPEFAPLEMIALAAQVLGDRK